MDAKAMLWERLERSILALEGMSGLKVTIVDRDGVFHSGRGQPVFSQARQSHRGNRVCDVGFCQACVAHCRYEVAAEAEVAVGPFVHQCWKGVVELVVPLKRRGLLYGSFFVGQWRLAESPAAGRLPEEFLREYARLELFDTGRAEALQPLLSTFADGLLAALEDSCSLTDAGDSRGVLILGYLRDQAGRGADIAGLARLLRLSTSRAGHVVREVMGVGFQELLLEERLNRAKALLLSSDCPVGEIARRVGFSDEYHFNRVFKRWAGMPPGRFRNSRQGR